MRGGWFGAAQVHGHGLADRVQGGVLLREIDGNVPVTMHYKFQQSVQMTAVVPRLQFIDRAGHCSRYGVLLCRRPCGFLSAVLSRLGNARRCATTGAGVLTMLFLWRCRCCSSSTVVGIPVVAVQALGESAADAVY